MTGEMWWTPTALIALAARQAQGWSRIKPAPPRPYVHRSKAARKAARRAEREVQP